jgi:hypothetical protein
LEYCRRAQKECGFNRKNAVSLEVSGVEKEEQLTDASNLEP